MKNENQTIAAKQEYQAPVLTELGTVSDLTLNAGNSGDDGMSTSV